MYVLTVLIKRASFGLIAKHTSIATARSYDQTRFLDLLPNCSDTRPTSTITGSNFPPRQHH
jgi:hypothetical protein